MTLNADLFLKERIIHKVVDGSDCVAGFDEISAEWFGKGIVLLSGRPLYLANAYINLCFIRRDLGCKLPVEIWYMGPQERNDRMFEVIGSLGGVRFIDLCEFQKKYPMKPNSLGCITHGFAPATTDGWRAKAYIILHSSFQEVLYIDSDCFLFQKPEELFASLPGYRETGAVFSADIDVNPNTPRKTDSATGLLPRVGCFIDRTWDYSKPNPMWEILGIQEDDLPEFDSGFIMVDKRRNIDPVFISFFLNDNSDLTYRYMYGDKDTFHIAWAFCQSPCKVLKDVSRETGHIVSRSLGSVLFEHRVFLDKFNVEVGWDVSPNSNDFNMRDRYRQYFEEARRHFRVRIF